MESDCSIIGDSRKTYRKMLMDIASAKKSIYLETYIYGRDIIGEKFRDALTKKAKQGVEVKILIDGWGSYVDEDYFKELILAGGELKFFKKLRCSKGFFINQQRDHRKLLLIDGRISFIGSLNIGRKFLDWLELALRFENKKLAYSFTKFFLDNWNFEKRKRFKRQCFCDDYQIIADSPVYFIRIAEKRFKNLIRNAKKDIMIITPYFIPSLGIRKAIYSAVKRGVTVSIIVPRYSNFRTADIIRDRYFGLMHKKGVQIYYYKPKVVHAKLMIIDDSYFVVGSSNIDYRSFRHQSEINLIGKEKGIINSLIDYFNLTLLNSYPFNYEAWEKRPYLRRVFERLLYRIRRFF